MRVNEFSSGEINATIAEMGATGSSRLMTDSKLTDGKKTSKKGLKLKVSYLQIYFINFLYDEFIQQKIFYIHLK